MNIVNSPGTVGDTPSGTVNSNPMSESNFHQRVDAILSAIENAMDEVPCDIDAELNAGILTLTFENDSKVIVNRQTPLREIWVAAKSGGFHFKFDAAASHGTTNPPPHCAARHEWKDTRSGETLEALLSRVVSEQSANVISITFA